MRPTTCAVLSCNLQEARHLVRQIHSEPLRQHGLYVEGIGMSMRHRGGFGGASGGAESPVSEMRPGETAAPPPPPPVAATDFAALPPAMTGFPVAFAACIGKAAFRFTPLAPPSPSPSMYFSTRPCVSLRFV